MCLWLAYITWCWVAASERADLPTSHYLSAVIWTLLMREESDHWSLCTVNTQSRSDYTSEWFYHDSNWISSCPVPWMFVCEVFVEEDYAQSIVHLKTENNKNLLVLMLHWRYNTFMLNTVFHLQVVFMNGCLFTTNRVWVIQYLWKSWDAECKIRFCAQRVAAPHGIESVHCVCISISSPGEEEQDPCYSPQKALTLALTDWLQEFLNTNQPGGRELWGRNFYIKLQTVVLRQNAEMWCVLALLICPGPCPLVCLKKESSDEEPMQTDMGESSYVPGPEENPLYTAEPLTLNDLKLLSDLFYLPYEHGPTARTMLQELDWLKNHSSAASVETDKVVLCVYTATVSKKLGHYIQFQ